MLVAHQNDTLNTLSEMKCIVELNVTHLILLLLMWLLEN